VSTEIWRREKSEMEEVFCFCPGLFLTRQVTFLSLSLSFPICGMRLMIIFLVSLQDDYRRNKIRCCIRRLTIEGLAMEIRCCIRRLTIEGLAMEIRCCIRRLTTEGLATVSLDLSLLLFSHLVVSNSLRPNGPQNARLLWSLHKLMSIELLMPSSHLILCCPLLLLPSIFPSIRVFFQ